MSTNHQYLREGLIAEYIRLVTWSLTIPFTRLVSRLELKNNFEQILSTEDKLLALGLTNKELNGLYESCEAKVKATKKEGKNAVS